MLKRTTICFTVFVIAMLGAGTATATAAVKPAATWAFSRSQVDVGQRTRATGAVTGLPAGTKVWLQKVTGTAAVWRNVTAVPLGRKGRFNVAVPPQQTGQQRFRVAAIAPRGRVLLQVRHNLFVYQNLTFSQVLNSEAQTVVTPQRTFDYAWSTGVNATVQSPLKTCRSVTLTALTVLTGQTGESLPLVSIVQSAADPASVQAVADTPVTVATAVTGSWGWSVQDPRSGNDYGRVYVNGTASCY